MSAFGQAGFGSMNRRNQLRAQGQMDPYGQQVRAAKQVPTLSIYQTQGTQQAAGQQQAPSQSQPAQQPAAPAAQPSAPAMPAYSPSYSAGTAQPIQPQSQGTPYGADPGYADRVSAAEQQWSSTPAGSRKVDWEGNAVRSGLARGDSLNEITRGLRHTGRFAADPAGAAQFANQAEQDWIASLSSGPPQAPGPNATASEVSAYFNASEAYGRQQKAQQARDERIAAEAAFNESARAAGEPSQKYIDETRRRVIDWGEVPFGMNPFAFRQNLIAGKIDISGRPVTEETPAWARYDYQRPQSAPAAIQTIGNTPGQAQPIQPQSQGTPYQSQPMVNDRPMRSIEDDMAADRELERQNGWWALEASRRGADPATGAPLASRSDEQAAYHSAAYAPPASQPIGNTPGQAQPIQPQSQGTPYGQELVSAPVGGGTGLFTPDQARVQREAEQQRLETQAWLDSQNNLLSQIEADALARPGRDAQMRAAQTEAARNQTQRDQQDLSEAGVRELLIEANRAKANIADLRASMSYGRISRDEFDRLMSENNKTLARANANEKVRRLLG